jgi:hypothetical protein
MAAITTTPSAPSYGSNAFSSSVPPKSGSRPKGGAGRGKNDANDNEGEEDEEEEEEEDGEGDEEAGGRFNVKRRHNAEKGRARSGDKQKSTQNCCGTGCSAIYWGSECCNGGHPPPRVAVVLAVIWQGLFVLAWMCLSIAIFFIALPEQSLEVCSDLRIWSLVSMPAMLLVSFLGCMYMPLGEGGAATLIGSGFAMWVRALGMKCNASLLDVTGWWIGLSILLIMPRVIANNGLTRLCNDVAEWKASASKESSSSSV